MGPHQIKQGTGLPNAKKVNDILKKLDKLGLTKSVKSVLKNNAKVWLLAELEPSLDVIAFDFDHNAVEYIQKEIERFARKEGRVTHQEIVVKVRQMSVDQPRDEYLQQIIEAMVFDLRLEVVSGTFGAQNHDKVYKAGNWMSDSEVSSYV